MKLLAAYLLAVLGGNSDPSPADLTKVLSAVGIEADSERASTLCSELKGKDLAEVISEGAGKIVAVPTGGGGGGGGGSAAPAAGGDDKKEEKKEEEEEEDDDMGFSLFD